MLLQLPSNDIALYQYLMLTHSLWLLQIIAVYVDSVSVCESGIVCHIRVNILSTNLQFNDNSVFYTIIAVETCTA